MPAPELHLFVIWPKALFVARRVMEDLRRETEVVFEGRARFPGDAALAYRRFYGPALPDAARKVANCGAGEFLYAVVRDSRPVYATVDAGGHAPVNCNTHMLALKTKYREWAGRRHRVHGTVSPREFARDVMMLTGRPAEEWERGAPAGALAPRLPEFWTCTRGGKSAPCFAGEDAPAVADKTVFLRNKYINDVFWEGTFRGVPCIEKSSDKAVWSIGNEFKTASRMYAAAPEVVAEPLLWTFAGDGRRASVATARVGGPPLSRLLAEGPLDGARADAFAADVLRLADALRATGVVHRDLFADNLLLGADGHLKAIDWQLAVDRNDYREDPWVERHWKFRYVVFGVNRELGLGVWNDFAALEKVLAEFPQTAAVAAARARLAREAPEMAFSAPPDAWTKMRLRLYAASLRVQMLLKGRGHRKYAQLERRWRTAAGRW